MKSRNASRHIGLGYNRERHGPNYFVVEFLRDYNIKCNIIKSRMPVKCLCYILIFVLMVKCLSLSACLCLFVFLSVPMFLSLLRLSLSHPIYTSVSFYVCFLTSVEAVEADLVSSRNRSPIRSKLRPKSSFLQWLSYQCCGKTQLCIKDMHDARLYSQNIYCNVYISAEIM